VGDGPTPGRYVRDRATLWRGVIGGVLIRPPRAQESWYLTSPGDIIWDLLVEPCTVDQLVETLSDEFHEAPVAVLRDIEPLLRTLQEIGAIRSC
jgi:hypothetical protein